MAGTTYLQGALSVLSAYLIDDFGISEGIDGRASSLDASVRAAGAIAEHYAPREGRWGAPDVVIYPTGGGVGIIGIWKAYEETLKD